MAGLVGLMIIQMSAEGMEKIKNKRAAKKRVKAEQEAEIERHQKRESYFRSTKAEEAEDERRRANEEELEAMGAPGPSNTHPALRRQPFEPPPPYIKDAPSYEEHQFHARAGSSASQAAPPREETAGGLLWARKLSRSSSNGAH